MARERRDTLAGTASPASGWLLIENRGPWRRRAVEDTPTEPGSGRAIAERARQLNVRPLFIRRHGRKDTGRGKPDTTRRFAFVDSTTRSVSWGVYETLADIAERDWSADGPGGPPMYLTCTHGRHDACCAIAGRPLAARMAQLRPELSWECSHVGGDRFAGNVVVLPYGLYYGFVDPLDAAAIVTATEAGEVYPRLLRGRSSDAPPVQAARIAAQQQLGMTGIDDLRLVGREALPGGGWLVHMAGEAGAVRVVVEQHRVADARATCIHRQPVSMRELRAVSITVDPDR
jgi:hypothetical protein